MDKEKQDEIILQGMDSLTEELVRNGSTVYTSSSGKDEKLEMTTIISDNADNTLDKAIYEFWAASKLHCHQDRVRTSNNLIAVIDEMVNTATEFAVEDEMGLKI